MKYKSNNLVSMKDINTGEVVTFIPNSVVELPMGEYINHNEARLIGADQSVLVIRAGETVVDGEVKPRHEVKKFNNQVKTSPVKSKARRVQRETPKPTVTETLMGLVDGN